MRSRKSLSGIIVEYTRGSLNTLRHRVQLSQNHITLSQCCYLKVNIFLRSYHIIGWIFYKQAVIISKIGAQTWKEYVIDYWNVSEIRRSTLLNLVICHCINSKCCQILSTRWPKEHSPGIILKTELIFKIAITSIKQQKLQLHAEFDNWWAYSPLWVRHCKEIKYPLTSNSLYSNNFC